MSFTDWSLARNQRPYSNIFSPLKFDGYSTSTYIFGQLKCNIKYCCYKRLSIHETVADVYNKILSEDEAVILELTAHGSETETLISENQTLTDFVSSDFRDRFKPDFLVGLPFCHVSTVLAQLSKLKSWKSKCNSDIQEAWHFQTFAMKPTLKCKNNTVPNLK